MQYILKNGEFTKDNDFRINHLGYGVFETFLARKVDHEIQVLALDRHLKRLNDGCIKLQIQKNSSEYYIKFIKEACLALNWEGSDYAKIRLIVYKEDWYLQIEPYVITNNDISLKSVNLERVMPEVKSCSAIACVHSSLVAKEEGYDEGLLIDNTGMVREASWGNIFFIDKSGKIHTPGIKILSGVTRQLLLECTKDKFDINIREIKESEVAGFVSAFTTRSTQGITPVIKIDHNVLDTNNNILKDLTEEFLKFAKTHSIKLS